MTQKVAVSGTHSCGKSALIDEFLRLHPDFAHEPEPYTVLEEQYGETFAAEPSAEDFYRQLEFNVGRLRHYRSRDRVIFERSPVDFLGYLLALKDVGRGEGTTALIERSVDMVRESVHLLDLIVFLPVEKNRDSLLIAESEDPELRSAVNRRLVDIFNDDDLNLFTSDAPLVVEASGSIPQRLRVLETTLKAGVSHRE